MRLAAGRRWEPTRRRLAAARALLVRVFFGSGHGVALFLGTLAFAGLYWRVGVFINDTYTLANAFVSLAEGYLHVDEAVYGPGLDTPGMVVSEGQVYGRNYGQLVVSLPFLWAMEAAGTVADPGLVLPLAWGLVAVALGATSGRLVGRATAGRAVGAVCGLAVFLASAAVARPLDPVLFPVVALQAATLVATALAATTLYRLLARPYGDAVGTAAGVLAVTATPMGFWATIPKRHAFTVALVLGVCYALYRSREPADPEALLPPVGFRALAYGLVGLMTWLHGGEAFVVFLALVVVDVPTAPSNDVRSLAVLAGVFCLSLVPFLVTNTLIAGDPLQPPRMLPDYGGVVGESGSGAGGEAGGSGEGSGSFVTAVFPPAVATTLLAVSDRVGTLLHPFRLGLWVVADKPDALLSTFVRSGYSDRLVGENLKQAINLSVAEAGPLVGGVVAGVAVLTRRAQRVDGREAVREFRSRLDAAGPARTTDAFAAVCGLLFVLVYLPRLPVHAQVTARYLLVLYPLALYGLVRLGPLRRVLADHWQTGLWTWAGGVFVGGQLFVVAVAAGSLGRGSAFQLHALAGLGAAALFAVLASASVLTDRADRATALAAGLAAALGTNLVVLSGLVYFQYGPYALPAAGAVADLLSAV
ncbi:hypothetical protein BRC92_07060 [Halobacteriales archaeon QS_4_69_31]|nr:MAG: hypothetical protein BRC92_07060 [Halobacteriales archaeon QS_4_69_31]